VVGSALSVARMRSARSAELIRRSTPSILSGGFLTPRSVRVRHTSGRCRTRICGGMRHRSSGWPLPRHICAHAGTSESSVSAALSTVCEACHLSGSIPGQAQGVLAEQRPAVTAFALPDQRCTENGEEPFFSTTSRDEQVAAETHIAALRSRLSTEAHGKPSPTRQT
jgi:hypothetical protein